MDETARKTIIREALESRLAAVTQALAGAGASGPAGQKSPPQKIREAQDPEEALRVLMVKLWPKIGREDCGREVIDEFVSTLFSLESHARGGDLRFLDAWNNAFEALSEKPGLWEDPRWLFTEFLKRYATLLEIHINNLRDGDNGG